MNCWFGGGREGLCIALFREQLIFPMDREARLLVDETESPLIYKSNVALTVAHEVAHMWFGDLVTMEWWTHLWLNEGFASWIMYLGVDHCFPEYDIWVSELFLFPLCFSFVGMAIVELLILHAIC